ncbi:guanitoxin biosynthesis L-enduracididine beta-hydroxylase GntD [Mucilaginibacter sp. RCC_168]|uniref:guanitoxin biosynthesis L-enduracididine beta-hydroxylase GntD n=1 Tax=Mucilaginibacter sp. RCC_168 TaxID=3239221 RepID=UPI003526661A
MDTITITLEELEQIRRLLKINSEFSCGDFTPVDQGSLKKLSVVAHKLPDRIIDFLTGFKYAEDGDGICLIRGFFIDEKKILGTPGTWNDDSANRRTKEESLFLLLCAAFLGDPIAWSTQQGGRIVHNIVPVKGDEYKQVGSSTKAKLWWHTEEAFHPCRCDYLGLLCLRNREKVATTYASVKSLNISDEVKRILFGPNFTIYPDLSHLSKEHSWANEDTSDSSPVMALKVPVLFGAYDDPYICIDPFYMETNIDTEAHRALQEIVKEIDNNLKSAVLEPGDLLFMDNYRVVHGRAAFEADFGFSGRWLKRVNITRDLRKSRALRQNAESRIIETISR